MTPKEKAKELVTKYSFIEYDQNEGLKLANPTLTEAVKQCALIAVDELMKEADVWKKCIMENTGHVEYSNFWQQVKEEINKL